MTITVFEKDLPDDLDLAAQVRDGALAVDTETMGLNLSRDRLCLVQISVGDGNAYLVRIHPGQTQAPNLQKIMEDENITKLFHYARFDVAALALHLGIDTYPIYCTKIAAKLVRTYTDRHGLKDLCKELIDVEISKQQQSSDWGADTLSPAQQKYAANDVYHLHNLKERLDIMLDREDRTHLAEACFEFIPARVALDLQGWPEHDIFAHN